MGMNVAAQVGFLGWFLGKLWLGFIDHKDQKQTKGP